MAERDRPIYREIDHAGTRIAADRRCVVREDFLGYYNRELSYLRHLGADFAAKHPAVASRLRLEPDECDDPHVERLLEAFAFLAARIHLRLDDEFPEITEAVLTVVYLVTATAGNAGERLVFARLGPAAKRPLGLARS